MTSSKSDYPAQHHRSYAYSSVNSANSHRLPTSLKSASHLPQHPIKLVISRLSSLGALPLQPCHYDTSTGSDSGLDDDFPYSSSSHPESQVWKIKIPRPQRRPFSLETIQEFSRAFCHWKTLSLQWEIDLDCESGVVSTAWLEDLRIVAEYFASSHSLAEEKKHGKTGALVYIHRLVLRSSYGRVGSYTQSLDDQAWFSILDSLSSLLFPNAARQCCLATLEIDAPVPPSWSLFTSLQRQAGNGIACRIEITDSNTPMYLSGISQATTTYDHEQKSRDVGRAQRGSDARL